MTNNTNRYQVTSETVEVGDTLRLGFGTLNLRTETVTSVTRWVHNQRYVNAKVTTTDSEFVLYSGTYLPIKTS